MKSKLLLFCMAIILTFSCFNVVSKAKILPNTKYTKYLGHITPKAYRGVWYNKSKEIGLSKIKIGRSYYSIVFKDHGKWSKPQPLKGHHLYVYKSTELHRTMYGFYAYDEDDFNFYQKTFKKFHSKKVSCLKASCIYNYCKSLKMAIKHPDKQ